MTSEKSKNSELLQFKQETSAGFWDFSKNPLFVGICVGTFENKEADIDAFLFEDYDSDENTQYLIPKNKMIADVVSKFKKDELKKRVFKIEFKGTKPCKRGKVNIFNVFSAESVIG